METVSPSLFDLKFHIQPQPTNTSCGPTCLGSVYHFYGDNPPISQLMEEIPELEAGGTLAVHLGIHALKRRYKATLYTYNLRVFDPTWFNPRIQDFRERLAAQVECRRDPKRRLAAQAYLRYLDLGGAIKLEDLNGRLIRRILRKGRPILAGLSSTFLYRACREMPDTDEDDDIRGEPCGHFVVLCGYDKEAKKVLVADPYEQNPHSPDQLYPVAMDRLLNSILLGVLTYDANFLIIEPRKAIHAQRSIRR